RRLGLRSAAVLGLSLADLGVRHARRQAWARCARELESDLRARLFSAVVEQDLAARQKTDTDKLFNAVIDDVRQIGALLERGIDDALLLARAPTLSLTAIAPLLLLVLPARNLGKNVADTAEAQTDAFERLSQLLSNSLSGIADIKSYGAEDELVQRVTKAALDLAEASLGASKAVSVQASLLEGVFMSGFSLMAALGGARVEQGRMTMEAYASVLYA